MVFAAEFGAVFIFGKNVIVDNILKKKPYSLVVKYECFVFLKFKLIIFCEIYTNSWPNVLNLV